MFSAKHIPHWCYKTRQPSTFVFFGLENTDFKFIIYFKLRNSDFERMELKRVWMLVLSFSLGFWIVVSVRVLASVLATIIGGDVTVA